MLEARYVTIRDTYTNGQSEWHWGFDVDFIIKYKPGEEEEALKNLDKAYEDLKKMLTPPTQRTKDTSSHPFEV